MASHMLQVVDPAFARDQYQRARARNSGRIWFGFGYSREWPAGVEAAMDIDSGPVVPLWEASASASGLAILAACAFEDHAYARALFTSLELAGFPQEQEGRLRYRAGNPVGDAVLLYAMVEGPLWAAVQRRTFPMRAPRSLSREFVWRAFLWPALFGIAHACGLREYVSVLCGAVPASSWQVFLGGVYLITYGGVVLLAPIFLLAALLLRLARATGWTKG
jgi:hypothetical protein